MSAFDDILGGADAPPLVPLDAMGTEDLAALLGVSGRTVRELAQKGIIAKDGERFPVRECVRAYCSHLREKAAGRGGSASLTQERVRVAKEQADSLAMRNAITRGEMLPARDVEASWSTILRDVRSAMLALPSRVQQRLSHLTAHDVSEIDHEVRAALQEASA